MAGVLCVYLLIGSAFAFAYGIVSAVENGPFFAQQPDGDISDFLYFSFVTLTTTGYGDLTAAQDFGRSLAITEALIGQIYLVTVVALIVGEPRQRAAGAVVSGLTTRAATPADAAAMAAIYRAGIEDRVATFETVPPTESEMAALAASRAPVVVAERDGDVVAWARIGPYSDPHHYYAGVGEATLYVARGARGAGVGRELMLALRARGRGGRVPQARRQDLHDERREHRARARLRLARRRRSPAPRAPRRRVEGRAGGREAARRRLI